ncbi:HAD family phosphatase [Rhizobiales bacterium]|uniref:HAD family hydrolase n=1 Tax=Hongsoonwoonella zoysiae TaxID=2821844 RepID=UPI00155FCD7E|nr:HAD family phosphatase [Hongsoonwoonella zoysiae]NRG16765.1 HAD family phosphatase [Hongsoonwoonella zoysiae]
MRPGLVIFDCDGVLVDTETVANKLLAELVTALGVPMDYREAQRRFMGRTMETIHPIVEELTGRRLPVGWADEVREKTLLEFEKGVEAIKGIEEVVATLKEAGVPYCVGSSGKYSKMHVTLGKSGLLPLFEDVLFSAEDCREGKPAPDIFLYAASGMGRKPEDCVVIEDSVAGVQAAKAAGMRVLGFTGDPEADDEAMQAAGAELFADMADLPRLLRLDRLELGVC